MLLRLLMLQLGQQMTSIGYLSEFNASLDGLVPLELLENNVEVGELGGLIGGGLEHWCFKLLVFNFALDILQISGFNLSATIKDC